MCLGGKVRPERRAPLCLCSCAECQSKDGSPTFHPLSESSWLVTGKLYLYLYLYLLLTPCSRVLLEKLTGSQLVKKFPAFHGTRRFITAFTSARHLSLFWASSIQSMPPHPTSLRSILILSTPLRLGLRSGLFPWDFPTKTLYTPLTHTSYMPSPSHFSRFDHPRNDVWAVQIIKPLIISFSPLPCYLVLLRPLYPPQHPNPRHPQPTFLPQCQRPRFTPIQNNLPLGISLFHRAFFNSIMDKTPTHALFYSTLY